MKKENIKSVGVFAPSVRPSSKARPNKGITIIALVITIVLMLILAGITVNVVINGGLLDYAKKAKDDTEIASEKSMITQAAIMAMGENKRGKIVQSELKNKINKMLNDETGESTEIEERGENLIITIKSSGRKYLVDSKGNVRGITWGETTDEEGNNYVIYGDIKLQIGDYITYDANDNGEYTYTAEEDKTGVSGDGQEFSSSFETNWRLLGVEHASGGDYLMLVPETPIQSTAATGLKLQSGSGYENGIEEMENISEIYGHGTGALYARTMTIEDVNKITGYDPLNTGDGTIFREETIGEYLNEVTCTREGAQYWTMSGKNGATGNFAYGAFVHYDENGEFIRTLDIGESMKLTSTFYSYYPTTLTESTSGEIKGITQSSREYSILFGTNKHYWLASSFINAGNTFAETGETGFWKVDSNQVSYGSMFYAGNPKLASTDYIMPIVYLKTDVNLRQTGNTVNSCTEWEMY